MGITLKGHSLSAWLGRLLGEGSIDVSEVDAGKPMITRSNDSLGKRVTDAVLDSMSDQEKLSMPLLEDEETGRQFALLILKLLAGRSGREVHQ
ncbi:hypothetical protein [Chromohalobacter israelensis]|uniref:hypothetical protein n=1 Tax=Chromohalobacter israelensis TaxID=141390 RepID=UPI000D717DEC|nr:hypothetical protein [Chromohalobacter salexigens]PWW32844.1 hypothetical protein DFO74_1323 [Chromohalobacter salexigens]